jgi:cold shock CspA family protein
MRNRGWIGVGVLGVVLSGAVAAAQDLSRYRDFELGSSVAAVSTLTGVAGSELKAIHQRPAVNQELTWRPRYGARRPMASDTESVDRVVFDFYDDRLFRVTVDTEYFFHQSARAGTRFDDLREGQAVSFTVGQGPKGPRDENVNVR